MSNPFFPTLIVLEASAANHPIHAAHSKSASPWVCVLLTIAFTVVFIVGGYNIWRTGK